MEENLEEEDFIEFVNEKKISINISIEKIIFFPGEEIKGFIYIKGKPILTNPLLLYSLVSVSLTQIYYYEYDLESKIETDEGQEKLKIKLPFIDKIREKEKQILYSTVFNYNQFLGFNIMNGLQLPFQLVLPQNLDPSFYYQNSYIRHILTFDFLGLESKNSIGLVIKNPRYFSLENQSLKEPLSVFKDMTKTKMLFFNQGKIATYITSKSNSYKYGEKIPINITIDASELNLNLVGIQIRFDRYINYNEKENKNIPKKNITNNLFCKNINFNEKKNNYKFDIEIAPPSDDFCIDPNLLYSVVEGNYVKLNFPKVNLLPFCSGGLIDCLYCINVKLCFDSMVTTNETINIPIELYSDDGKKKEENIMQINEINPEIKNPYNEIFNDDINSNLNINSVEEENNKKNDKSCNGFEVIDQEDFIKAMNGSKNKNNIINNKSSN
jgi:hypothetical protein